MDIKKNKVFYYTYKMVRKIVGLCQYYPRYFLSLLFISKNKKRVSIKIQNKEVLNVIFIIQYIPAWNKLEPIYNKMKNDKMFNPIIVCVPLNIQNNLLQDDKYSNDTYEYFIQRGYEAINALRVTGEWFDLRELHPDYVFHSRPYNHFMPKPYVSDVIAKYALICNVLYGPCMSHNGLKVCINKDYYKNVYCYFAFDKYEEIYYKDKFKIGIKKSIQLCEAYGATALEQVLLDRESKKDSRFAKTVLWTPRWSTDPVIGGSNFFNYKDVITKLIQEYPENLFIIRPHPLMFDNFIKTGEMSEEEVKKYKEFCRKTNNVILDEGKEYIKTFWQTDFAIMDPSAIVFEYIMTGKPILYCDTKGMISYTENALELIDAVYSIESANDLKELYIYITNGNDEKYSNRRNYIKNHFYNVRENSEMIKERLSKCL